jgi:hypothetical protein
VLRIILANWSGEKTQRMEFAALRHAATPIVGVQAWLLKNSISEKWSKKLCARKPYKRLSWFS